MCYFGYVRISSEEQGGKYSLAQEHAIESRGARQKIQLAGQLTHVYVEECRTGMNDQHDVFQ